MRWHLHELDPTLTVPLGALDRAVWLNRLGRQLARREQSTQVRIARDLVVERQARVRAEERADMAARVHDSVLQTLALIQRRADDPQKVIQLARMQERELRSWLFEGRDPDEAGAELTVAAGVRKIQQDVEARYGVPVEAVTVGDCDLDDNLTALLAAAGEATVNAAKWSGASVISLFAEVEPHDPDNTRLLEAVSDAPDVGASSA